MNIQAYTYLTVVSLVGFLIFGTEANAFKINLAQYGFVLLALALVSFLAEIYELRVMPNWHLSTSIAVNVSAILIGGPALGIWVVVLSAIPSEIFLRWDKIKEDGFWSFFLYVTFNTSQLIISVAAAAFAIELLGEPVAPYKTVKDFLIVVAAFGVYQLINALLVAFGFSLVTQNKISRILKYALKNLHLQLVTMGVLALLIAILYSTLSFNIIYAFIPLALVHYSMKNYLELRQASHQAFVKITELLEQRDPYTGEHSQDAERLAVALAQALALSDEFIEDIQKGAAIHDIGKIAIPDAILLKKGPLTEEEWAIMKTHPVVGADILGGIEIYKKNVVPLVRHEHEHWDGGGYPDGLSGEDIPLGARIIAVADVYSALTTPREYRPAQGKPLKYTHAHACSILKEMAGKVLDPNLVEVFIEKVASKEENRIEKAA